MASLYRRARSPYFWLRPKHGKAFSTKLRAAVPKDIRQAHDLLEAEKAKERAVLTDREKWEHWVPRFIRQKYEESPKSKSRYELRWRSIRAFLLEHNVTHPRRLTFELTDQYLEWRRAGDMAHGVRACHKNTAIGDVKFLGLLMRQAVRLGYAGINPCSGLGLVKAKAKPKQEISDDHLQTIWRELQTEPEWMRINFLICLHTGCRLREAAVPLDCVDLDRKFIHFPDTKGDKPFTAPMRDELVPLFTRLQRERPGRAAFDMPKMPSKDWWAFFQRIGLPQYCMHGLRVTFISRLARAKVPMSEAMKLVNHASEEIHRIYQRFQPEDLRDALSKVALPTLSLATPEKSESRGENQSNPPSAGASSTGP